MPHRPVPLLPLALCLFWALPTHAQSPHRVVVLVYHGFSPALLATVATPAFDRLGEEGAYSHRVVSTFPTGDFVNGASLATGCWPERHGIIADTFLDPERGRYDREGLASWLTGCEGLARVAERQGVRVTSLGWYLDSDPERCDQGSSVRDAARHEALLGALREPLGEVSHLVLARFCRPGAAIRDVGVDSAKSRTHLSETDARVAEILAAIEAESASDTTLFLLTDHGMREVSHLVQLDRLLKREGIRAKSVASGSTALLYLEPGQDADRAAKRLGAYRPIEVLRRGALPAYAHLGEGDRVPELIVSAFPPYFIEDRAAWPYWLRALSWVAPDYLWAEGWMRATSGFAPRTPAMYGLLYAWGAGIPPQGETQAMRMVDLHPTIARALAIEPGSPLDGGVVEALFEPDVPPEDAAERPPTPLR